MLTLRVTSISGAAPEHPIEARFDSVGGAIGRADDNRLVLPMYLPILVFGGYLLAELANRALGRVRGARVPAGEALPLAAERGQLSSVAARRETTAS